MRVHRVRKTLPAPGQSLIMVSESDNQDSDVMALAEAFLDLWQDNVRAWAVERDLLTPDDLKAIVRPGAEGKDA